MSDTYMGELLKLADRIVELDQMESELSGTSDWKVAKAEYEASQRQFETLGDEYIDGLLASDEMRGKAVEDVEVSIAEFREHGDPSWQPALAYFEDNFLPKLRKEAARSPHTRKAIKALPWALGALVVALYFGIRIFSGTPVAAPLESREGLEQRAAATEKVIRYDDWMGTRVRRGGWLKGIMLWPVEPTESEIDGAAEFVALVIEGQGYAGGCGAVRGSADGLSDAQIDMIGEVAEYVRADSTVWKDPSVETVLDGLEQATRC